ncbi:hypothetical protein IJG14_08450 [bacterium]|nr:hypothetical protein [bacterium]
MGNLLKLLFLAGIIYGIVWIYQNVNFNDVSNNLKEKIQNEKTVVRVIKGREQTHNDALKVTE